MMLIIGDARDMDLSQFQKYSTIVADPPWYYPDQKKVRKDTKVPTKGIGACHHYDLMMLDEICAMPITTLTAKKCLLFLWTTAPKLPEALAVMNAWGFDYSTVGFVWVKLNPKLAILPIRKLISLLGELRLLKFLDKLTFYGPGYYTGSNVELVLIGRKKKVNSIRHGEYKASQVFYGPRTEHSRKPDEIQSMIERMYPGPYLELFARRPRDGWDTFGNEVVAETAGLPLFESQHI